MMGYISSYVTYLFLEFVHNMVRDKVVERSRQLFLVRQIALWSYCAKIDLSLLVFRKNSKLWHFIVEVGRVVLILDDS